MRALDILMSFHDAPRPFRSLANRLPPRRRRPHRALQLALRAPSRRHVHPAHRRHRRAALVVGDGERHPRRALVAGYRLGRGAARSAGRTRRTSSPSGWIATAPPHAICSPGASPSRTRAPSASRSRPGKTTFADSVHGPIEFDNEHIEHFVILRSDAHPTYHLSVVVDDIDMQVTHVVRGDDHISNTPKQVLLYQAFGAAPPVFRARAAHHGSRQEAPEQAPRRHLGDGVREAGLPPRGDVQLPGAARLGHRQRRRDVHARGADRALHARGHLAAATPSSTSRSSTGSTTSTCCASATMR